MGLKPGLDIIETAGLDFIAFDASFTRHHVARGMQLHVIMGRTGQNRNTYIAFSFEQSETAASYLFLAQNLEAMGFRRIAEVGPGPLKRRMLARSDGFKGTKHFSNLYPRMGHALCSKHLAASARDHVRGQRAKGDRTANPSFHDNMIYNVAKASSEKEKLRAETVSSFGSPPSSLMLLPDLPTYLPTLSVYCQCALLPSSKQYIFLTN